MTAAPEADATITSHGRGRAGPDWPGQGWAGAVAWLRSSACPGWSKPALSHGWGLAAQLGCQWGLGPPRVAAEFQEQVFRAAGRASCRPKLCPRLAQRASQHVALIKAMPLPGQARGQRTTRTSGQHRTLRWETRPSSISKNITRTLSGPSYCPFFIASTMQIAFPLFLAVQWLPIVFTIKMKMLTDCADQVPRGGPGGSKGAM